MDGPSDGHELPHAMERVDAWRAARQRAQSMLVALDFDGTLTPIVSHPDEAHLAPDVATVLDRLVRRVDTRVAVISGRALDDVRRRTGVPGIVYAGNHGLEMHGPGIAFEHVEAARARPALQAVARRLEEVLRDLTGAWVEDKGLTVTVHFRNVSDPRTELRVRARVIPLVSAFPTLRCTEGRKVVEVRPAVRWDKGHALLWLAGHADLPDAAPCLYVGDDRTDEDAFRVVAQRQGGIIVASTPPADTAACAWLASPADVTSLLVALAA
jgi:trehalose 6-phosphate phosphatase